MPAVARKLKLRWRVTALGYGYLLGAVLVFLLALNFSNNLLFTYSFLLVSIALVNIFIAKGNIKGIKANIVQVQHGYQGDYYAYNLTLQNDSLQSQAIYLAAHDYQHKNHCFDLPLAIARTYQHKLPATVRGKTPNQPLVIYSRWPLGLIEVTKEVTILSGAMVYPKPEQLAEAPTQAIENSELQKHEPENLEGVRAYQVSDSPKRIHWQAFAKTETLQVKDFSGGTGSTSKLLDWANLSQLSTEQKLSCLCYWLLFYQRQGAPIGLQLPAQLISPTTGAGQLERCLSALAIMPKEQLTDAK